MTEKLYQMFQLQYDQVAEMMKMQNQMPLVTMAEYLDNTTIEEIEGRDYTDLEVLELLETDCQNIMALAKDIRDEADKRIISCSPTCWKNISQFMPKNRGCCVPCWKAIRQWTMTTIRKRFFTKIYSGTSIPEYILNSSLIYTVSIPPVTP